MPRTGVGPVRGISSMATRDVLADACAAWSQRNGPRVDLVCVGGVDALRRVREGEAFDFVVLAADAIERLAADAHVDAASVTALARSAVVVAVRAGFPRPDLSSEATVREAVCRARAIGYSTGPSGRHMVRLFERWALPDVATPRKVEAPPGTPVAALIADGEVDLGFQQASELMHAPGVDVAGPLPREIQSVTIFSGAVCTASRRRADALEWLAFVASPQADAMKRRYGMEPP